MFAAIRGARGRASLALVLLLVPALLAGCARRARQPNIVLISIDTLRADRLGAYGHTAPTSPNVDRRLAAEGVTFTRTFSQSPKTTPSHMTMLTSLYPTVHGVGLWKPKEPSSRLRPEIETLAEVLHAGGFKTVAFTDGGHMHGSRGFDQGFDVYEHGLPLEKSLEWLRAHGREGRFFLFFHTYSVHDPYLHPLGQVRRFDKTYRGPLLDVVRDLTEGHSRWADRARAFWDAVDKDDPATVAFLRALYETGIRRMDDLQLGKLLDTLDALDLSRETLVVFTSDHGEAFLEHGHFLHNDLHAETLHVPLILRLPGRLAAGKRIDAPVTLLDVMPTILDLAGLASPAAVQGRSLVPLLNGGTLPPRPTISEWTRDPDRPPVVAIRDGAFTYITDGQSEALFDVAHDPGEQHATAAPDRLAAPRQLKAAWERECRAQLAALGPLPQADEPNEETQHQLRALGYVK